MKKAMEVLVQFKFVWGLFFAATVIIYTIINMLLGNTSMELIVIWQLFLLSIVLALIQYLVFGEFVLTDFSLKKKIFIHFPLCYFIILMFMYIFNWISFYNLSLLAKYTGAYLFIYLTLINSLYMYYKVTGEELNSRLAIYKQNKNNIK